MICFKILKLSKILYDEIIKKKTKLTVEELVDKKNNRI